MNSLRMVGGELQDAQSHLVEVTLPLNYPRTPPQCRMLSPVFHPNIAPHAICVGDHWGAGESLESIIIRIGEMLAYQSYNVKSPLNGEAARWVEENKHRVPLDKVSLLPEEENGQNTAIAAISNSVQAAAAVAPAMPSVCAKPSGVDGQKPAVPAAASDAYVQVNCPQCASAYRVASTLIGRMVRCKKCNHQFACAASL